MHKVLVAALFALSSFYVPSEEKLGAGVTLTEATSIADVVKTPEAFVGKTIRIDGTATAVCEEMGCWMAVSESDKADAPTIRLKVEHGAGIVFPISAKGKLVSAQGTFERIGAGDTESHEAAAEHAQHHPKPTATAHAQHQPAPAAEHAQQHPKTTATYQLKATGAIIK
jgi:hypothetical protein